MRLFILCLIGILAIAGLELSPSQAKAAAYPQRLNTKREASPVEAQPVKVQTQETRSSSKPSRASRPKDRQAEQARKLADAEAARREREEALDAIDQESVKRETSNWKLPVKLDPNVRLIRVYDFLNDPKRNKQGSDEALNFEFKYFNHGAVTEEQLRKRRGQYFIVSFENKGPAADYVLRLDYRQSISRERVRTLQLPFKAVRGERKGRFSVTGEAYAKWGVVNSWRISVVRSGVIVAQTKSFIW